MVFTGLDQIVKRIVAADSIDGGKANCGLTIVPQEHLISQIVETVLIAGTVDDLFSVGAPRSRFVAFFGQQAVADPEHIKRRSNAFQIAGGEVGVGCADMNGRAVQGFDGCDRSRDDRFTFAGMHFNYRSACPGD